MSRNYYSEINLHLVWHTKNSLPLLTPQVEPLAHRFLKKRIMETPGAFVHEIGGIETHVHLAVTVPPTLLISEFIGKLKGGSSHDVNQALARGHKVLEWQSGYGVVSFGTRDLPWVIQYIATSVSTTPAARRTNGWSASRRTRPWRKWLKPRSEKDRERP